MKTNILFLCISLLLFLWIHPASSQVAFNSVDDYKKVKSGLKVSGHQDLSMNSSDPQSKKMYEDANNLQIVSIAATGASLAFLFYYGIKSSSFGSSSFWSSSTAEKPGKTSLYIGSGLLLIGAATGITSIVLFDKSGEWYGNAKENQKSEHLSLRLTVQPGLAAMYVRF